MAHQAHALPWNTLAKHYKYMISHVHEPHRKDIFPAEKGIDNKEIDYFCRALAQRVQEFAATERAKYRSQAELRERAKGWTQSVPTSGGGGGQTETRMVYPDEMQVRYFEGGARGERSPGAGDGRAQSGSPAAQPVDRDPLRGPEGARRYHQAHDDGGGRHAARPLPEINLAAFLDPWHDHRHGVCVVAEEAVRVYVYLNLLFVIHEKGDSDINDYARDPSTGEEIKGRKKYMDLVSFNRLLELVAGQYDGDAFNLVHWDFFWPRGEEDWIREQVKDILADVEGLKDHLKGLWRLLVVYNVVVRELGGDPGLEKICKTMLGSTFV
ncbi:hypothetical protein PG991_000984 [Apiospora marii]|uniref:Uncharacterized protein n=1 Tax=Apiospora marii TaxID=335849 RepID=A0ABR1SVU3_9PEZI